MEAPPATALCPGRSIAPAALGAAPPEALRAAAHGWAAPMGQATRTARTAGTGRGLVMCHETFQFCVFPEMMRALDAPWAMRPFPPSFARNHGPSYWPVKAVFLLDVTSRVLSAFRQPQPRSDCSTVARKASEFRRQIVVEELLSMDEILHHQRNPGMMIPL